MKKRIIYFILILIIVMLHIPITSSAESLTEIQLNANLITDDCLNPIRSDITEPEQTKYFRFMPLETGNYTFEVICNEKIASKLYHKSIGKIDEFASDEVVGNSFDVFLVADEEYYFSVNFKDSVAIGQFTVRMHKHIDMFLCPKCNENYSSTYFPWQIGNNVAYVHDNTSGKIMLYGKGETWGELPLWQISDGYYIEIVEVLDGVTLISSSFFRIKKRLRRLYFLKA